MTRVVPTVPVPTPLGQQTRGPRAGTALGTASTVGAWCCVCRACAERVPPEQLPRTRVCCSPLRGRAARRVRQPGAGRGVPERGRSCAWGAAPGRRACADVCRPSRSRWFTGHQAHASPHTPGLGPSQTEPVLWGAGGPQMRERHGQTEGHVEAGLSPSQAGLRGAGTGVLLSSPAPGETQASVCTGRA